MVIIKNRRFSVFKDRGDDRKGSFKDISNESSEAIYGSLRELVCMLKCINQRPLVVCFYQGWSEKPIHVIFNVPVKKG